MNMIPAISLHQPYASALFVPRIRGVLPDIMLKSHETRKRRLPIKYIGVRVAIHAAKRNDKECLENYSRLLWGPGGGTIARSFYEAGINHWGDFPLGCLIGTVIFMRCMTTEEADGGGLVDFTDRAFGDWSKGRFAWRAMKAEKFKFPIHAKGFQGWFNAKMP